MVRNLADADQLSTTFAALADPTRRAILARLSTGEASVTELAEPFEMSMPAISKHLKVLERAGLIARGREAQWRPCRLEAAPLKDVAEWVKRYQRFWEQRFDNLDAYLRELKARDASRVAGRGRNSPPCDSPAPIDHSAIGALNMALIGRTRRLALRNSGSRRCSTRIAASSSRSPASTYTAPVVTIQRRLAELYRFRVVSSLALGLTWWVLWIAATMVGAKLWFGIDLYGESPQWIQWSLGAGVLGMAASVALARRFADRQTSSLLLRNVIDNLAGRSLLRASRRLDEIAQFERG